MISFTPTQISTTSTFPSPVLQTSHLPRRNSSSAPIHLPSQRSVLPPSRPSPALAPTTLVDCSCKSSTTRRHLRQRRFTSARQHGQTTTRFSRTSIFLSRTTHTLAKTPRALTSMEWSAHSNLHPKEALCSSMPAHTTPLVSTLRKISGSRLPR